MSEIIKKTYRFDELDVEMLEEASFFLKRTAKTDIDVIRYCLDFFIKNRSNFSTISANRSEEEDEEVEKPRKLSKRGLTEVKRMIDEDVLCALHPDSAMSQCLCNEKTPAFVERMVCLGYSL